MFESILTLEFKNVALLGKAVSIAICGVIFMTDPHRILRILAVDEEKLEHHPPHLTGKIGICLLGIGLSLVVCLKYGLEACRKWSRMVHLPLGVGTAIIAHRHGEPKLFGMAVTAILHAAVFGFFGQRCFKRWLKTSFDRFWFATTMIYKAIALLLFFGVLHSSTDVADDGGHPFLWHLSAIAIFCVCNACICAIMTSFEDLCTWKHEVAFWILILVTDIAVHVMFVSAVLAFAYAGFVVNGEKPALQFRRSSVLRAAAKVGAEGIMPNSKGVLKRGSDFARAVNC